jgi:hypothetical protein
MQTTATTTEEPGRFTGDRYERMTQAAELLASDQNIAASPFPYDPEGMRAFTATIAADRLLDDLTDHDADRVAMYSLLDFCRGARAYGVATQRSAEQGAHLRLQARP